MEDPVSSAAQRARRSFAHWMSAGAAAAIGLMLTSIPASADQNEREHEGSRGLHNRPPTLLVTPPLYWENLQVFICSVANMGTAPQEVTVTTRTEYTLLGQSDPLPDMVSTITLPPGPVQSFRFSVPRRPVHPTANYCIFESRDTSMLRASAAVEDGGRILRTIVAR